MAILTQAVFPTSVGVNLWYESCQFWKFSFPHKRGGEPEARRNAEKDLVFSPQAWG